MERKRQLDQRSLRPSSSRLRDGALRLTSENGTRSWLAWNSTNSSPGESEQDPMAHVGEACSGAKRRQTEINRITLRYQHRQGGTHQIALWTLPKNTRPGSLLLKSRVFRSWGLRRMSSFGPRTLMMGSHSSLTPLLIGCWNSTEYRRAPIFPPPNEAVISTRPPATHGETPRVTNNPEPSRHPINTYRGPTARARAQRKVRAKTRMTKSRKDSNLKSKESTP